MSGFRKKGYYILCFMLHCNEGKSQFQLRSKDL